MAWSEVRRSPDGAKVRLERAVFELPVPQTTSRLAIRRRRWRVIEGKGKDGLVIFGPTSDELAAMDAYCSRTGDQR